MVDALRELLPTLFILYFLSCLTHTQAGTVVFVSLLSGRFHLRRASLTLAGLIPWDTSFNALELPIIPTVEGIYLPITSNLSAAARACRENYNLIQFSGISLIETQRNLLLINDTYVLRCSSSAQARYLNGTLQNLVALSPSRREDAISTYLSDSLDLTTVWHRLAKGKDPYLLISSSVLSVLCLLVLPATTYIESVHSAATPILFAIAITFLLVCFFGWRWVRYAKIEGLPYSTDALWSAFLFPPSAFHLRRQLAADVMSTLDYLVIALAVLPPEDAAAIAMRELHLAKKAIASPSQGPWAEYWCLRLKRIDEIVEQLAAKVTSLESARARSDPQADAYCPACDGSFRTPTTRCDLCDLELIKLALAAD